MGDFSRGKDGHGCLVLRHLLKKSGHSNEWPFLMQGSDTMDYCFTRGEDKSEQIKKHIKEAAQSIIDHADDIVDQYDLLTDLKIEMNLNPDNNWLPKVQVTSSFLSERTIMLEKKNETGDTM